jgi:hypothetical protein
MSEHLVPEEYERLGTGAPQFEHDATDGVAGGVPAVRARLQVALDGLGLHGAQAAGFQRVEVARPSWVPVGCSLPPRTRTA